MLTGVNDFSVIHTSFPCSLLQSPGLSSRLTWHDFEYVTMALKVPSSTLVYHPYPSFLERSGPHIPVAQDPPSAPQARAYTRIRSARRRGSRGQRVATYDHMQRSDIPAL